MDFCPLCGSMILPRNGILKCPSCGYDENSSGFQIRQLIIKPYSRYISNSDKQLFQNDFNLLISLIENYNKLDVEKQDLIDNFDKIIRISNENFIEEEKKRILKEFRKELNNCEKHISDSDKDYFKEKYNKYYYNYYDELDFEKKMGTHNKLIVRKQKGIIYGQFKDELNNFGRIVTDLDKEKLEEKYTVDGFNYYKELKCEFHIDKFNEKLIEKQSEEFLSEFKLKLIKNNKFINEEDRTNFKNEYNQYYPFYDNLNFDSIIDEFNDELLEKERENILKNLENKYISYSEQKIIEKNLDYDLDISKIVDEHNDKFIEQQIESNKSYFETLAGRTLDYGQMRAVLTDDDVTQVVAGAGTGKTLTIQAKVKYLIEKQGISPEDILCISYSNSACDDLASKLEKTLGNRIIDVKTFHSLGFNILKMNQWGNKVPSDEIRNLIDTYFKIDILEKPNLIKDVIEFFSYYYDLIYLNQNNLNFETLKNKVYKLDEFELILDKEMGIYEEEDEEYVHSIYELIIANYLFIHNIDYELFKNLVSKTTKDIFENVEDIIPEHIKPGLKYKIGDITELHEYDEYSNFYLPEKDVYINLLNHKPDWKETSTNQEKIMEYFKMVDDIHSNSNTKIINIYDYGYDIESILSILDENLNKFGFRVTEIDYSKLFEILILDNHLKEYNDFIKNVETFINLFKGNAYNIDYNGKNISKSMFMQFKNDNKEKFTGALQKRNNFFLEIIEKIYEIYSKKIDDEGYIDYNDMINNAVVALRNEVKTHNYKYIIVDEYQDTSHTRYNLLKEMQNTTGAKLVVVGDDWQSIYGFTGCDVSLFSNFNQYFENSKMVKIDVTYRNSQDLIDVCGDFIQKNKNQIPKELKSAKGPRDKPIKLVEYVSKAEVVLSLLSILDEISQKNEDAKIMILGRNNRDKKDISCKEILTQYEFEDYTKIIYSKKPQLNIEFRTVHKSKGLQADYVVVLNLTDKINGFPNKIVNDPILDFVENKYDEKIPYPEERRLFYVALTRTENDVYVFYNSLHPSSFIEDIKEKNGVKNLKFSFGNDDIHAINLLLENDFEVLPTNIDCPNCGSGKVTLIVNNNKGTSGFKCSNRCRWDGGSYHNITKGEHARKISHLQYARVCKWCNHMLVVTPRKKNPKIKFLGCNHFPLCNNAMDLPKDFIDIETTISKLDKTRHDVYYLTKYVPSKKIKDYGSEEIENTEKIWGYKDGDDEYLISSYTKKLMEAIVFIIYNQFYEGKQKIALVPVPSSKVKNKNKSTMKKSINIIETWYKSGITEQNFNCIHELINYNDLLTRVVDVPTAHLGEGRASCKQHVKSIEFNKIKLPINDEIFFILDDVTTSGETMKACKQILINNNVDPDNIFCLAIGATVRDDDEEI